MKIKELQPFDFLLFFTIFVTIVLICKEVFMENLLREYMERTFPERGIVKQPGQGPVVTISREFGCPSKLIAHRLTHELNRRNGSGIPGLWRFINKEVVEATAHRLEMNPGEVDHLFGSGTKGVIEDVLASFTPNYVSNIRVKKTIIAVVRTIAEQGHVVIVGRGGAGILQNFPRSLHVCLRAPLAWRIEQVGSSFGLSHAEASKLVDETDKKRTAFIELMTGKKFHPDLFDLNFNCSSLSLEEITGTIVGLMVYKKMI